MRRLFAIVIFGSALVFAPAALSLPTSSELKSVAASAGAAAAGFALCGDKSKARQIKSKFEDVALACTSTKSARLVAMNAFDLEYANTLNAYSQVGGTCRGQNEARFDTVIGVLDRAEESCDD